MNNNRLEKIYHLLEENNLDCLVLNASPNLFYTTGLNYHLSERPVVLFITKDKKPVIILPGFETGKLGNLADQITAFGYDENPANWNKAFSSAANSLSLNGKKIGFDPLHLRMLEFNLISAAADAEFISAEKPLAHFRMKKDDIELEYMKKAAEIAEKGFLDTLSSIKPGVKETDISAKLMMNIFSNGQMISFSPIVASGPNGANPHATPGERTIKEGDLIVIDWGAMYKGYISDITRTVAVGKISDENEKIAEIVKQANIAGRLQAKAGVSAGSVDKAARKVIEDAGYGQYFTTRTGHGLGLEVHETPYMFGENELILEEGFTFSVEPGIYIPGKVGVRIEDDVAAGITEGISLTSLPRELFRV